MLKVKKEFLNKKTLSKYGFVLGNELAAKNVKCFLGDSNKWKYGHFFKLAADKNEEVIYTDEECNTSIVELMVISNNGLFVIECTPYFYDYNISGFQLDVLTDTIFEMTKDNILERI